VNEAGDEEAVANEYVGVGLCSHRRIAQMESELHSHDRVGCAELEMGAPYITPL